MQAAPTQVQKCEPVMRLPPQRSEPPGNKTTPIERSTAPSPLLTTHAHPDRLPLGTDARSIERPALAELRRPL